MSHRVLAQLLIVFLLFYTELSGQQSLFFPLTNDFADEGNTRSLQVIPNNDGETGVFGTFQIPPTTCAGEDLTEGYFFERDAGFEFLNEGFIDCEYTLQIAFKFDDLDNNAGWVRILSFTHTDDIGLYLNLSSPPDQATLEFWPNGTVGTPDFFNDTDVYQLTLVRQCDGMMDIYVNGEQFAEFDDGITQQYIPQPPNDYIVFFRDHPSVLANEASPGWTKNFMLADHPWTLAQVSDSWNSFCDDLLSANEISDNVHLALTPFPNPAADYVSFRVPDAKPARRGLANIYDLQGRLIRQYQLDRQSFFDISQLSSGTYILEILTDDSIYRGKFIKE